MDFKLKGSIYPISNSSDTLLSKIATSMQNGMSDEEDDRRVAYAISKACPDIPATLVSYENKDSFFLGLDAMEIGSFMISLNIAILERTKTQSEKDKKSIKLKIKEMRQTLKKIESGLDSEQVKVILGAVSTKIESVEESSAIDDEDDEDLD